MRAPIQDPDPARAELVCARIARALLGDSAPALVLLSKDKRRRAQALAAWTATLFDLALRPGLAGLDGDRLAQINAWEFQSEMALDGSPPGQPVFVMLAREHAREPWPREALDRVVASARATALRPVQPGPGHESTTGSIDERAAIALLQALFSEARSASDTGAGRDLAPLLTAAAPTRVDDALRAVRAVNVSKAPPGWRRAASYVKRVRLASLQRAGVGIGLGARLRHLAGALVFPR